MTVVNISQVSTHTPTSGTLFAQIDGSVDSTTPLPLTVTAGAIDGSYCQSPSYCPSIGPSGSQIGLIPNSQGLVLTAVLGRVNTGSPAVGSVMQQAVYTPPNSNFYWALGGMTVVESVPVLLRGSSSIYSGYVYFMVYRSPTFMEALISGSGEFLEFWAIPFSSTGVGGSSGAYLSSSFVSQRLGTPYAGFEQFACVSVSNDGRPLWVTNRVISGTQDQPSVYRYNPVTNVVDSTVLTGLYYAVANFDACLFIYVNPSATGSSSTPTATPSPSQSGLNRRQAGDKSKSITPTSTPTSKPSPSPTVTATSTPSASAGYPALLIPLGGNSNKIVSVIIGTTLSTFYTFNVQPSVSNVNTVISSLGALAIASANPAVLIGTSNGLAAIIAVTDVRWLTPGNPIILIFNSVPMINGAQVSSITCDPFSSDYVTGFTSPNFNNADLGILYMTVGSNLRFNIFAVRFFVIANDPNYGSSLGLNPVENCAPLSNTSVPSPMTTVFDFVRGYFYAVELCGSTPGSNVCPNGITFHSQSLFGWHNQTTCQSCVRPGFGWCTLQGACLRGNAGVSYDGICAGAVWITNVTACASSSQQQVVIPSLYYPPALPASQSRLVAFYPSPNPPPPGLVILVQYYGTSTITSFAPIANATFWWNGPAYGPGNLLYFMAPPLIQGVQPALQFALQVNNGPISPIVSLPYYDTSSVSPRGTIMNHPWNATITGYGFVSVSWTCYCIFFVGSGNNISQIASEFPAVYVSSTQLNCLITPVNGATSLQIVVGLINDPLSLTLTPLIVDLFPVPTVAAISPPFDVVSLPSQTHTTTFSITGTNFVSSSSLSCQVAWYNVTWNAANTNTSSSNSTAPLGYSATFITNGTAAFQSSTSVLCTLSIPVLVSNVGNVSVSNDGNTFSISTASVSLVPVPIVNTTSESSGSAKGGLNVTLTGSGFLPSPWSSYISTQASCVFGTTLVPVLHISNTTFACSTPPIVGAYYIGLSLNGQSTVTLSNALFTYIDNSDEISCRGTSVLSFTQTLLDSVSPALVYYDRLFTQTSAGDYINMSSIVTTVSPALLVGPNAVDIAAGEPGSLIDGDRCCAPTVMNEGTLCGANFALMNESTSSLATLTVTSDIATPAYVNELLLSWYLPCFSLPSDYYVEYRDVNGTWKSLLTHNTDPNTGTACQLINSDVSTAAFCFDFFQPVLATGFSVSFNNSHMTSPNQEGYGWVYEIEPHGVFFNQPVNAALQLAAEALDQYTVCDTSSSSSIVCTIAAQSTVNLPDLTLILLTVQDQTADMLLPQGTTVNVYMYNSTQGIVGFGGPSTYNIVFGTNTTGLNGLHLSLPVADTYAVRFQTQLPYVPVVHITVSIIAGLPASMQANLAAQSGIVGILVVLPPITVILYDIASNVVTSDAFVNMDGMNVNITVTNNNGVQSWSPGQVTLSGGNTAQLSNGVATFSGLTLQSDVIMPTSSPLLLQITFSYVYNGQTTIIIATNSDGNDLAITIAPGEPSQLVWVSVPSSPYNNGDYLSPQPRFKVVDGAGNLFTSASSSGYSVQVFATISPTPPQSTSLSATLYDDGYVTFSGASFVGSRGVVYTIRFTATVATTTSSSSSNLPTVKTTVQITPCSSSQVPTVDTLSCQCGPSYQPDLSNQDNCTPCPTSGYKPFAGQAPCTSCPSNMETFAVGAANLSQCVCIESMFLDPNTNNCEPCLAGAVCPMGSTLATMYPQPGYFRFSTDAYTFYQCSTSNNACAGGSDDNCTIGYTGPLCSVCEPGYGGSFDCAACLSPAANWFLILLAGAGIILVVSFTVYTTTNIKYKKTGVLKTMLNYLQLLSFLLYFNLDWPNEMKNVFGISAITTLQINFSPITCLFGFNYYSYFVLYSAVPLIGIAAGTLVFVMILYVLVRRNEQRLEAGSSRLAESSGVVLNDQYNDVLERERTESERPLLLKMMDAWVTTLIVVVFLCHPLITKNSLEVFDCVSFDVGTGVPQELFLATDLSVSCTTPLHTTYQVAAAVVLSIFVAGVPIIGLLLLIWYRNRLQDEEVERKYRFLYSGYVYNRYYWEFVITGKQVGKTIVVIFKKNIKM